MEKTKGMGMPTTNVRGYKKAPVIKPQAAQQPESLIAMGNIYFSFFNHPNVVKIFRSHLKRDNTAKVSEILDEAFAISSANLAGKKTRDAERVKACLEAFISCLDKRFHSTKGLDSKLCKQAYKMLQSSNFSSIGLSPEATSSLKGFAKAYQNLKRADEAQQVKAAVTKLPHAVYLPHETKPSILASIKNVLNKAYVFFFGKAKSSAVQSQVTNSTTRGAIFARDDRDPAALDEGQSVAYRGTVEDFKRGSFSSTVTDASSETARSSAPASPANTYAIVSPTRAVLQAPAAQARERSVSAGF